MRLFLAWLLPVRIFALDYPPVATLYTLATIHDASMQFLRNGAALAETFIEGILREQAG